MKITITDIDIFILLSTHINTIKCFTDASYSPDLKISIIGYKIGDQDVITENLPNVKNTQAELYAINKCIDICKELYLDQDIIIHTDCQRALKNEYPVGIKIKKVKGHKKKLFMNEDELLFNIVDKATRKELRKLTKNN